MSSAHTGVSQLLETSEGVELWNQENDYRSIMENFFLFLFFGKEGRMSINVVQFASIIIA